MYAFRFIAFLSVAAAANAAACDYIGCAREASPEHPTINSCAFAGQLLAESDTGGDDFKFAVYHCVVEAGSDAVPSVCTGCSDTPT
ncbi:hypothetical protein BDQ17DRAFT_1358856 [Cyathus striatus]|nr:hypothetical protein BDQ17DRAFT_1383379 [Cyathus striatus]KAF9001161.1 hypothetical protein BDQ17DRAFT_1358856 [Cyathus striatus]